MRIGNGVTIRSAMIVAGGKMWFLTSALWLTCALGSGSVKSWKFKGASYAYPPSAMTFLEGIKEAVIFGKIYDSSYGEYYTYVTTMTDSNKLSGYTTLEGVLEINSVVAHATDDNVVLVAGVAESGGFTTYDMAFVGALYVSGGNNFYWEMFSLVGESSSSYDQRMSCVEVFPDSNMFVAAGNSDGAGEGNGMIFAAYDLDDFSQLYAMQHTAYYYSDYSVGAAEPRGMARIGSNDFVVANTGYSSYSSGNGLCRFSVSRDSMEVQWCRTFISDSYKDYSIAGVHVSEDSTILVTGYKYISGYYYPFVRHFDMQGRYQQCYFWEYDSSNSDTIYTSFYDSANDLLYLGGSYYDDDYYTSSLVLIYSVSGQYLHDARVWKGATNTKRFYYRPESVRGIAKSDNGTLMFANEPYSMYYPDKSALVTVTNTDCFNSHWSKYTQYSDNNNNNTNAQTVYFGNYSYAQVSEGSHGMEDHSTLRTKALCGKSGGNNVNVGAIVGGVVGGICGCIILCVFIALLATGSFCDCCYCNKNNYKGQKTVTPATTYTTTTTTTTTGTGRGLVVGSTYQSAPTSQPVAVATTTMGVTATEQRLADLEMREAEAKRMMFEAQQMRDAEAKRLRDAQQMAVAPPMNAGMYASAPGYYPAAGAPPGYGAPPPDYGAAPPGYGAAAPPAYGGAMYGEGATTGELTEGYAGTREAGNRY